MTDMTQMLHSMENAMRLQNQAKAERRAEKAAKDKKEFQEKLMRAASSDIELSGTASKAKGSEDAVRRESDAVESTFKAGEYRILTDIRGELVTSEELAALLDAAFVSGKSTVRFIIGGSRGVDDRIRASVDKRISFGRLTYPHQLMRVMLFEQIYRAFTITSGLPYHK